MNVQYLLTLSNNEVVDQINGEFIDFKQILPSFSGYFKMLHDQSRD